MINPSLAAPALLGCAWAFSSCGEQGPSLVAVFRLLTAGPLAAERGLAGMWAALVVAHGLGCPAACGIFVPGGLNPCPLHWQADSLPLDHQGSPSAMILLYRAFHGSLDRWEGLDEHLHGCPDNWKLSIKAGGLRLEKEEERSASLESERPVSAVSGLPLLLGDLESSSLGWG